MSGAAYGAAGGGVGTGAIYSVGDCWQAEGWQTAADMCAQVYSPLGLADFAARYPDIFGALWIAFGALIGAVIVGGISWWYEQSNKPPS